MAAFSRTGEHAASWLTLGAAGALAAGPGEHRRQWLRGVGLVAASYAVNTAIKWSVRRPRPRLPELPPLTSTVSGLSFPSAHSTTSFAAVRAYRELLPSWALYPVAVAYALSRPYLGVHYPSDVIAGALLGTGLGQGATPCR